MSGINRIGCIGFLLLFIQAAYAQYAERYQLGKNISLSLPANYVDTVVYGQEVTFATTDDVLIFIGKTPLENEEEVILRNRDDLLESYEGLVMEVAHSYEGELLEKTLIKKNNLEYVRFTFTSTDPEFPDTKDAIVISLDDWYYLISYSQAPNMRDSLQAEREAFFDSIELSEGLGLENQLFKR